MKIYKANKKINNILKIIIILITLMNTIYIFTQTIDEDEIELQKLEISLRFISLSLDNIENYDYDYIPSQIKAIHYFVNKYDFDFYIRNPRASEVDPYFPYNVNIDNHYENHSNYYKVYYDMTNNIVKEEYYENNELKHFILLFYNNNLLIRERITYLGENTISFDYFHYRNINVYSMEYNNYFENATVLIKYINNDIDYINLKYKNNREFTLKSEYYDDNLRRNGIWYYYNNRLILSKKEYWENNRLIKYITYSGRFIPDYFDKDGNIITKVEFDSLD